MAKPQPKPATKPEPKPVTKPESKPAKAAPEPRGPVRLQEHYHKMVVPNLMKEFSYTNRMQVPRLECIVLNVGMGEATQNVKLLDSAVKELATISGQHPVVTRARKAIANFKLRKGLPIGAKVTLRGKRMYEFFDRLVTVALRASAISKGFAEVLRRTRQLHAGAQGAADLSRNRVRHG